MDEAAPTAVRLNHGQRKTVEQYWSAERIGWIERQCELALLAGQIPLSETRRARKCLMKEAARLAALTQAAMDQLDAIRASAGEASDVLAKCEASAGDIRKHLAQSRAFAWQLENELEWLGADRKPEERPTLLIKQIAKALVGDGHEVNATQSGALYQVAGLALGAIGVEPKDLRKSLKQILERDRRG